MTEAPELTEEYRLRLAELAAKLGVLPDKPEETPEATLRALWHLAGGVALSVEAAREAPLDQLSREAGLRLRALIAQRIAGVPLAHLTGRQRFMGLEMLASGDALIPRRETELVGYAALELLRDLNTGPEPAWRGKDLESLPVSSGSRRFCSCLFSRSR